MPEEYLGKMISEKEEDKLCKIISDVLNDPSKIQSCKARLERIREEEILGYLRLNREEAEVVMNMVRDEVLLNDEINRLSDATDNFIPTEFRKRQTYSSNVVGYINNLTIEKEDELKKKYKVEDWTRSMEEYASRLSDALQDTISKISEERFKREAI